MGSPNFNVVLDSWWGGDWDSTFLAGWLGNASGVVVGTNPPYGLQDVLTVFPQFFGTGTLLPNDNTTVLGSPLVLCPLVNQLAVGSLVTGTGIAPGSLIISKGSGSFTMSLPAVTSALAIQLLIYQTPLVPFVVMSLYIALASASLVQQRWRDTWYLAMALYVAHFLTMWMRAFCDPKTNPTAKQVAVAGIEKGMLVAKSAGDVSGSYQNMMEDYASWGTFTETTFGSQLISFARWIGMGAMYVS